MRDEYVVNAGGSSKELYRGPSYDQAVFIAKDKSRIFVLVELWIHRKSGRYEIQGYYRNGTEVYK